MKHRAQRKALEVEPNRRDVLAEISGAHVESGRPERIEQFARDQMNLPQVWRLWIAPGQVPVPHEGSRMRIAFDAVSTRQSDGKPRHLAEAMLPVDRNGEDRTVRGGALLIGMSDF